MEQEQLLKILMLEDNDDDVELIVDTLRKQNISFVHRRVETREDFCQAIDMFTPDIVLSDHGLPGFNSLDALKICLKEQTTMPFILVAGALSDELVSCLRGGADDYVLKSNLSRLPGAIIKAVDKRRNGTRGRVAKKWVKKMARKIIHLFLKPQSKFKMNQAVQHISGGPLMVVSGYTRDEKDQLRVICNWYDRNQRTTLRQEFSQHELKHFDWNNPHINSNEARDLLNREI